MQFTKYKLPGDLYLEERFNGGFSALPVWGAYIWRGLFSEFYGILKLIISAVSVLFEAHEVLLCKRKIGVVNIFMLVTDSYTSLDT